MGAAERLAVTFKKNFEKMQEDSSSAKLQRSFSGPTAELRAFHSKESDAFLGRPIRVSFCYIKGQQSQPEEGGQYDRQRDKAIQFGDSLPNIPLLQSQRQNSSNNRSRRAH
ncbi:unnamed protein product [Haemonchus placei]|uniref:CACTA en-spm transposon protein n=1 Tax=Haemonchus placei TaxID=6290 RepID=A0A0N4WEL7_HAEPC|nr:unnamed protein product [Haemonchus placei]